jgi:putative colanic acid biosynthesis UDP-glucose lipid carrier transferase
MIDIVRGRQSLLRTHLSVIAVVRAFLDPLTILCCLVAVVFAHGERFDGAYLILALIVFSLTFPGQLSLATSARVLMRDIGIGWLLIVLILVFLGYATRYLNAFPHDVLLTWFVVSPITLFVAHRTIPVILPGLLAVEGYRSAVVVGTNELALKLAREFNQQAHHGVKLAGFFDDRSLARIGNLTDGKLLGSIAGLPDYIRRNKIDSIYIALPMASQPRIMNLLDELRDTTTSIYFVPDIFVADLIQARMDGIGNIPVLAVCETPFYGVNGMVKRISDIVIAGLILIGIAPIMLTIALVVKLSSPGPALFKQRRYGLDGREFIVYKFRSMTVCEDGAVIAQATKQDARVTRIGAILRKTSLDELPQFINVLQGRMSVVGPRPHAVAHNETYRRLIKGYMVRHKVKPGITGWAQISGYRGETDTLDKMRKRIEYDLDYLRNWSLKLDLYIIFRTVFVVFGHKNAH